MRQNVEMSTKINLNLLIGRESSDLVDGALNGKKFKTDRSKKYRKLVSEVKKNEPKSDNTKTN